MKRRDFLHNFAHAAAFPTLFSSVSLDTLKPNTYLNNTRERGNIIVFVKLEGGNDGLNTIIPMNQLDNLNQVRPHVVLPEDRIIQLGRDDLGIHPALSNFKSFFEEERLKIIQNVGYPNPDFSHFRSMDIVQSAGDSNQIVNTGWIGRYLESIHPEYPAAYPNQNYPHPLAVELSWQSSLAFTGISSSTSFIARRPQQFQEIITDLDLTFPNSTRGQKMEFLRLIGRQSNSYSREIKRIYEGTQNRFDYPNSELAQQLEIVSRLIKGGLNTRIYMVDHGSFDTHDQQVSESDKTEGEHARLLKQLNDAITPFIKNLDDTGDSDRVLIMTFSEFGRTVVSNGSRGTDHGSVAPILIFGNKIDPTTTGSNPVIDSAMEWQDNLPMEIDFRSVYNSLIDQWMGKNTTTIERSLFKAFPSVSLIKGAYRDQDGDGISDPNDLEVNSTFGALVDTNGVEIFQLPSNNYTIRLESVSCIDKNDGSIEIEIDQTVYNYSLSIPQLNETYPINATTGHNINIDGLLPGIYNLVFTVEGKPNYEQHFDIEIKSPPPLSAKTIVNKTKNSISLNLYGSSLYWITLNEKEFYSNKQTLALQLRKGLNILHVKSNKPCQGEIKEEVFISEEIEFYPNPTKDHVNFYIHGNDTSLSLRVINRDGDIIQSSKRTINSNRKIQVQLEQVPKGIYMIQLNGKTVQKTVKIIRE